MTFLVGWFRLTNFGDFRLTVFGQFNPTLTGENIPTEKLDVADTRNSIEDMIAFFGAGCRQIIVTDCFWRRSPLDELLQKICREKGYTFCKISDIYEEPKSMALNEYENESVALHPFDYGMRKIAERIAQSVII